jgi:tetratricopeptide (TPR) repeat protein
MSRSKLIQVALLLLAGNIFSQNSFAGDQECRSLKKRAEKELTAVSPDALYKACEKSAVKDVGRPLGVIGDLIFQKMGCDAALPYFLAELKLEPEFVNGYLSLSGCYISKGDLDRGINMAKKGLEFSEKHHYGEVAKLNFNVGLGLFKKAAAAEDVNNRSSEPYFKKSSEQDPSLAQNYFYLGYFAAYMDQDYKKAKALYGKGCKLNDQGSCKQLPMIEEMSRTSAPAQAVSKPASTERARPEEQAYLERIKAAYVKKGMTPQAAESALESVKGSYVSQSKAVRIQILQAMLKSLSN